MRSRISSNRWRISERARFAPRQKCGPRPPNAMWSFGDRSMRNALGSSKYF
jgi:hypothetical protein